MFAPEFAPFIQMGKHGLKHFMKGKTKHEKHKHHESKEQEAFGGKAIERQLEPMPRMIAQRPAPQFKYAADGVRIPQSHFDNYISRIPLQDKKGRRVIHQRNLQPWKNVAIQSNLRSIVNHSGFTRVSPKNLPADMAHRTIDDYAKLNRVSALSDKSIPVLQGDMGSAMDMAPVTITKTENHAIIAGSELLADLMVPLGSGQAGNVVLQYLLNPRTFSGTRLEIESKEWLMFKFRKFIIEYIPTIGSGTTGNFISYFTQDPNEENQNGIQARRNALEHSGAVPFQPFSYMVCGMVPAPKDETLYFISDNDQANDDRLMFQDLFRTINNALNADTSTVPTYGTVTIHYECDYYFPAIAEQTAPNGPANTDAVTLAAAADAFIQFQKTGGSWPQLPCTKGDVYQFNCGTVLPALQASNTYFTTPYGANPGYSGLYDGQMYYLSIVATSNTTANFYVYDQLTFASAGTTQGALFAKNSIIAGVTLQVLNLSKVSPMLLAEVKQLVKNNKSDFTDSECEIIELNRKVKAMKTDEMSPRFQTRRVDSINSTQLPAIHVTATTPRNV